MTQAALVLAGIELMESGGRDEEVIGIMMLSNALAGDDEDDEDMALLLLAIAADEEDTTHLPDPYLPYVRAASAAAFGRHWPGMCRRPKQRPMGCAKHDVHTT